MTDMHMDRQNNKVLADLLPAYKLAGYKPPRAVSAVSASVTAAAEFPAKVQQAREQALAARDVAVLAGDVDAAVNADLRAESCSRMLTTGTLNTLTAHTLTEYVSALCADYVAFGRDALVKAANAKAQAFNAAYQQLEGLELTTTIGNPEQAARLAELRELGSALNVYRGAIDRLAIHGHSASLKHPVTGDAEHRDVTKAETLTRYLSGVGYPQPSQALAKAPVDPHFGPAAPWVALLERQAVARPRKRLEVCFRSHAEQAADMTQLVNRWAASQSEAGACRSPLLTKFGWTLTSAQVDEHLKGAADVHKLRHSVPA